MMEHTMQERVRLIIEACMRAESVDPVRIFRDIAAKDFVRMHGPEHHILDGACVLTAYRNAGGDIALAPALEKLAAEGLRMPGAVCGLWGVCGAVMSMGAALAIIDGTGPLSSDGTWGRHMQFTSAALQRMGEIDGPRCCKRDAFISFEAAIRHINENYAVQLPVPRIRCERSAENAQCIRTRCPYFVKE